MRVAVMSEFDYVSICEVNVYNKQYNGAGGLLSFPFSSGCFN